MPSITPPAEMPEIVGLFVGGCVERGDGSSFRHRAHAHTSVADQWRGWVCVRSAKRILTPSGKPSRLMWHEYAHITVGPKVGHGPAWRDRIAEYGFPAEGKRYVRVKRPPLVWFWTDRASGELRSGSHREMVEATR